jgi:hypothetical protein
VRETGGGRRERVEGMREKKIMEKRDRHGEKGQNGGGQGK